MWAVRPKPSPTALQPGWAAGASEVSRFSCRKFVGVSRVFDYAGLKQELALVPLPMLPTAHYNDGGVRVASFRSWIPTPPTPCQRFDDALTGGIA